MLMLLKGNKHTGRDANYLEFWGGGGGIFFFRKHIGPENKQKYSYPERYELLAL